MGDRVRLFRTRMVILEQLRPFVMFCQFYGMFPYYMELDPITKKFKMFSFSVKHPVTWWFFFVILAQLVVIYFDIKISWKILFEDAFPCLHKPTTFVIFFCSEHLFFFILVLLVRYMTLQYSHLRKAIIYTQKAHSELQVEDLPQENIPAVKRRVFVGLFLAVVFVSLIH